MYYRGFRIGTYGQTHGQHIEELLEFFYTANKLCLHGSEFLVGLRLGIDVTVEYRQSVWRWIRPDIEPHMVLAVVIHSRK
jgi:hypothetical protein